MARNKKRYLGVIDKWIDNLLWLNEYGIVGACPYCKSENTHYGYMVANNSDIGWGAVWCADCRHGIHLCRVKITEIQNMGEPIPQDIIY